MKGAKLLITVTRRSCSEGYIDFFRKNGINNVISLFSNGTVQEYNLAILGLEKVENIMFITMIKDEIQEKILSGLVNDLYISSAGNGLAMTIPIDSVGGSSALNYFIKDNSFNNQEKNLMNTESKNVLIISIVDKGNTETVMDAARSAGASGGTVVRARGTGAQISKFFGVSISEEKEMVYIVASRDSRDGIMKAIMEKAGNNTDAHGVIFTLPVESLIGIKVD